MVALLTLLSGPAVACSVALPARLIVDDDPDDVEPPPEPLVVGVEVTRGRGPRPIGCSGYGSTSCDDLGLVRVDTQLAGDAVGLELEVVDGEPPEGTALPDGPFEGDHALLVWTDGAGDEQEPIAFTVALRAVDAAGNRSEPVEVDVAHAGRDPHTDCSHVPGTAGLAALAAAAWTVGRRRRPTSGAPHL